jgi:foldase protein PrsA
MRTTCRYTRMLAATVLTVCGLAACGGGSSDGVVAQVDGVGSITEATLNHWVSIFAVDFYELTPTTPIPKGVLPDPPDYTACIAFLRSNGQKPVASGPKPTTAQLRDKCEQQLHKLKVAALNALIGYDWTLGEGAALGMKITPAEIRTRFTEVSNRLFPRKGEFRAYLEYTGQTLADMMLRTKVQLVEVKETALLTAAQKSSASLSAKQREATLRKLVASFPPNKQWAAKTSCRPGFVTSACRQYRGSEAPGFPN